MNKQLLARVINPTSCRYRIECTGFPAVVVASGEGSPEQLITLDGEGHMAVLLRQLQSLQLHHLQVSVPEEQLPPEEPNQTPPEEPPVDGDGSGQPPAPEALSELNGEPSEEGKGPSQEDPAPQDTSTDKKPPARKRASTKPTKGD
ncbi:hypothetical protein CF123_17870 [Aeromonas veronii]|uniref:Uncharacterized protein n=1 Tax=Aeromonas veronii TaxID=654 RepID=A0AAX2UP02_AERVE|nr:hypothetical protein [Aeromonas veronii]TND51986.1 hypothetical protein CF123_17870 [Aeromonas veronii]